MATISSPFLKPLCDATIPATDGKRTFLNAKGFQSVDPMVFGFGSNGAGELYVFEWADGQAGRVLAIDAVTLDLNEALVVAPDFGAFVESIGQQ